MKFLTSLFGSRQPVAEARNTQPAPMEVVAEDPTGPFPLLQHLHSHEGMPIIDWAKTLEWALQGSDDPAVVNAVEACKRGWLLHLRDALGYALHESEHAFVLSTLDDRAARGMLEFIERTQRRIQNALEGIADPIEGDRQVLIVFHDEETYYRYVSHAYPEEGEFAFSSGMFLRAGCPHFVTTVAEMETIERVIVHEMTHANVSHLDIPLWLNEGLAVNVENRLMGKMSGLYTPAEMREKHLAFWNEDTIQGFWSGRSFGWPGDGSTLSYDLAQVLTEILAGHWEQFREFTLEATYEDAGTAAAREHFGLELGDSIASIFEQSASDGWSPDPERWRGEIAHTPE